MNGMPAWMPWLLLLTHALAFVLGFAFAIVWAASQSEEDQK